MDIGTGWMSPLNVEREIGHASVLGNDVVGAVRFGDDGDIGLVPVVDEVFGAQAALQLG